METVTFKAILRWKQGPEKEPAKLSHDHLVVFPNKVGLKTSSSSTGSSFSHVSPEEMLVASVSSCQMASYLYLSKLNNLTVYAYKDFATGFLEEQEHGWPWMARILLKPKITLMAAETEESKATAIHLIQEAREHCAISKSLRSKLEIEPHFRFYHIL